MKFKMKYTIAGILSLCYFWVYNSILPYIIPYHEQHHLFLYTKEYWIEQIHLEGVFSYLTNFIIQFFYYPALGCAILSIMIASVYLLVYTIIQRIFGKEDILLVSLIPAHILFLQTLKVDYTLTHITTTILVLCLINTILYLFRRNQPILSVFKKVTIRKRTLRISIITAAILIHTTWCGYSFVKSYNREEGITQKTYMHVKTKNWEKVLKYTNLYLSTSKPEQTITYFHNLALYHTGGLLYHLFDYPQILGVNSLYLPWDGAPHKTEYGHFIYEDLGHINEALHWESEAMVVWGENANHLLKLAQYNILTERPKIAQRFINKLKHTLFYRNQAILLEKKIESGKINGMRDALSGIEDTPVRFTNFLNIGHELEYLCNKDPKNQMAFEYYMSYLLLSGNVPLFMKNLHRIHEFNYPALPPIFEEALLLYNQTGNDKQLIQTDFVVSKETEKRFIRYNQLVQNNQQKELQREFINSYWFYLNYIIPYKKKEPIIQ
jgi:hypothetical protein